MTPEEMEKRIGELTAQTEALLTVVGAMRHALSPASFDAVNRTVFARHPPSPGGVMYSQTIARLMR